MIAFTFGVKYIQQPEFELTVLAKTLRGAWTVAAATITEDWDEEDLHEAGYKLEFIRADGQAPETTKLIENTGQAPL